MNAQTLQNGDAAVPTDAERMELERVLRASEERFRSLVEMSSDAIVLVDERGQVNYASPSLGRVLGYSANELLGRSGFEFVHADDMALAESILRGAADRPGEHISFLLRVRHKDGSWRWVDGVCTNHLHNPAVQAVVVNYRDITVSKLADEALRHDMLERRRAEEKLRESEERLRLVISQAPALVWTLDQNLRITLSEGKGLTGLGLRPGQLVGMKLNEFLQTDDPSHPLMDCHLRAIQGQSADYVTNWAGRMLECRLEPMLDADGQPVGCLGVGVDVTERNQSERALRESEERYRSVVEGSLQGILIHQDEHICYANESLARMFGYESAREIIGRPLWETFASSENRSELQERTRAILAGQTVPPHPGWRAVGKDGRTIWVSTTASRIDFRGRPAVVAFYLDITERKLAEQSLRESEERFRNMADNSPVMIWVTEPDGYRSFLSQSWCEFTGQTREIGLGFGWVEAVHPDDRVYAVTTLRTANSQRERFALEYRMRRHDGEYRWVIDSAAPRIGPDRAFLGFIGSVIDITDRIRAEEERRQLEAQILHAQKLESLGVLAGGIAHDFNNLLTSMLGYASLALMQLPNESPACSMLHEIEKAAQRAGELTQQMLAYSGKGKFVIQPLRVDRLVQEMTKLLRTVVSKKATIELNLEPAVIEGDATQIRQVIMNLITNASDALEGNQGVLRVRTGIRHADTAYLRSSFIPDELPAGDYAFFEIEDNGCGMNEDTLARVFDPFFTTKFTGRGLGLAAVLGIVRGHRGTIKARSTPGKGTVFQVLIPCTSAAAPAGENTRDEPPLPRGQGTILIIEDEPIVREFSQRVLESAGFQVLNASDGRNGLEKFGQHCAEISAVLLDLTMPHMDGMEVLRHLRGVAPELPVLVMSGYSGQELSTSFAGSGASGFIQKPFHPRDLATRMCELLKSSADNSANAR